MLICDGVFETWSSPRTTCVIPSSQSSTGEAKLYVGRPSDRTMTRSESCAFWNSILPLTASSQAVTPSSGIRNRIAPSSSYAFPSAASLRASSWQRSIRSSWNVIEPSQSMPSHVSERWICSTDSATSRLVSVFSIRSRHSPPRPRAKSQLKRKVRTPPMWRRSVGIGGMRTRTLMRAPRRRRLPPGEAGLRRRLTPLAAGRCALGASPYLGVLSSRLGLASFSSGAREARRRPKLTRRSRGHSHSLLGCTARSGVGLDQIVAVTRRSALASFECFLNDGRNREERQSSPEEGGDGDFVGCVVGTGIGSTLLAGPPGERKHRECLEVRGLELEHEPGREVERLDRRRRALRIRERVRDGHPHVGIAEMGEGCAVPEAHQRMHDRGRVHDDLDALVGQREQEMRLDQLEALVGERRRVDRDLGAHGPGWMRERFLRSYGAELVAVSAAKGPTGSRQDERLDCLLCPAFEALEGGAVLAVHGQQQPPTPLPRGQRELAGDDEALLVRKRELNASLQRPESRIEPGEADDGVQDDLRLCALQQLGQVAADLAADRAGRAEDGHSLHRISVRPTRP